MSVTVATGEASMEESLKNAILGARNQTAQNLMLELVDVKLSLLLGYRVVARDGIGGDEG